MMPTALNICTCGIFATSLLIYFGPPTYFFHTGAEGHSMPCSVEEFFLKK